MSVLLFIQNSITSPADRVVQETLVFEFLFCVTSFGLSIPTIDEVAGYAAKVDFFTSNSIEPVCSAITYHASTRQLYGIGRNPFLPVETSSGLESMKIEMESSTGPAAPEVPELPEVPSIPLEPEVPEEPELPLVPEVPLDPSSPLVPELPLVPDEPEVPLEPVPPEVPLVPDVPSRPDVPLVPEVPLVPDAPV